MSLPPLPPHVGEEYHGPSQSPVKLYDGDQLHAYGQQCYAAGERKWRQAVDGQLVMCEMVTSDDPRESLERLINWNCSVALDPLVSSDAEALIAAGADAERERCADICSGIAATHTGEARRLKDQFATLAAGMRDGANECAAAIRSAP